MNAGDPYLIPGTSVLRNKLGITEALKFDYAERELVTQRIIEGIPEGCFDLVHLQAIHRHLFLDIYEWAGAVRTVEIAKAGISSSFVSSSRPAWGMFTGGSQPRIFCVVCVARRLRKRPERSWAM